MATTAADYLVDRLIDRGIDRIYGYSGDGINGSMGAHSRPQDSLQAPEPDGFEGLAGVRIIEAARRSAREGRPIPLESVQIRRRPSLEQELRRPPVEEKPAEVHETGPRAG